MLDREGVAANSTVTRMLLTRFLPDALLLCLDGHEDPRMSAIIQDVASKLPDKIGRRTYDISTCVFMEAQPYQSMDVWPFTLLPVNIVKISPLESLNLDDLETLVFRGFDMEQCCLHVSIDD